MEDTHKIVGVLDAFLDRSRDKSRIFCCHVDCSPMHIEIHTIFVDNDRRRGGKQKIVVPEDGLGVEQFIWIV